MCVVCVCVCRYDTSLADLNKTMANKWISFTEDEVRDIAGPEDIPQAYTHAHTHTH